jgi:hypothetical protein
MPEVLALLRNFVPSEEPVRYTISALGQRLREAVEQEPGRFAATAPEFAKFRPIYARRLLEAIETVVPRKEKSFEWTPILSLMLSIVKELRNETNAFPQADGDDEDWSWCCSTAAKLLKTALGQSSANLGLESAEAIENFIVTLFERAPHQPSAQDFESQFEKHPAFTAGQSLWGSAIELCLIFIVWHSRQEGSPVHREPRSAFQLLPSIATLLERSLDDRSTWGRIPRAALGQRLTWLNYFGEDWLAQELPALLRGGPALRDRMAAWLRWILGLITPPISPRLPA